MKKCFLFFPFCFLFALCEDCEERIEDGYIHSLAYGIINQARVSQLHSPYLYYHSDWVKSFLEQCSSYSIYREKFNFLIECADVDFEEETLRLNKEIKSLEKRITQLASWENPDREEVHRLQGHVELAKNNITNARKTLERVQGVLHSGLGQITKECEKLYNLCIKKHNDKTSFYERRLIYFDLGRPSQCIKDFSQFLDTNGQIPSIKLYLATGIEYSNLALYNEALQALTKAIQAEPENREAFLERAGVYFEMGNLEKSIEDFLSSGFHTTPIDKSYLNYANGFLSGLASGIEAFRTDFFPGLLTSAKGLSSALWALSINSSNFPMEVGIALENCLHFISTRSTPEIIEAISPLLKELIYETTSEYRKGEILGHLIAKEGIEILVFAGSIKVFQELRKANMVATLEMVAASRGEGIVIQESERWAIRHAETIKKLRQDEAFLQSLKGQNLSETTIRRTIHELGYQTLSRPQGIPHHFKVTFSDKKFGMKYIDPMNEHTYVRVMPGNALSPNSWQQKPYVNYVKNGQYLDKQGNPVLREMEAAHIPFEEFIYRD